MKDLTELLQVEMFEILEILCRNKFKERLILFKLGQNPKLEELTSFLVNNPIFSQIKLPNQNHVANVTSTINIII